MNEPVSDSSLTKVVNDRLQRAGGSACRDMRVTVIAGTVTLMGALRFETQRRAFYKAISSVAGVRTVIDKMTLAAVKNKR